jgi:competence protein ComEC
MRLKCQLHVSWLIGWAGLGLVAGAAACIVVDHRIFSSTAWLVIAISVCLLALVKRWAWMVLLVFVAGCLAGLWHGSNLRTKLQAYQPYYGREVVLKGRVAQDASLGEKGDQRLNLKAVEIDGQQLPGQVWVSVMKEDVKRGDTVTIKGNLNSGFGNLSAAMYRVEIIEIVRPHPGDVARRVRDWFGAGVRLGIPEPQVNLGLGYLLGQKTALPPDLEEQVRIVGLTHVVVASGYNLTILVIFARKLFARISKYLATFASSLMIISFVLITGLSPSMSRAGLVAGLGLLVWYYGRKMHPFILLSFAAAVTVLINPSYVWGDLGWYLSFTAFIGVIVLAPLLQKYFWGSCENVPMFRQLLVDTSSAQILTMPIILSAFGQYSIYALPANLLVLPLVPLAMLCTFITGISGLIIPGIAEIIGLPATWILKYSTTVIEKLATMPNSQNELSFNPALMSVSYLVIAIVIIYLKRRTKHDFRATTEDDKY